jgi:hypothetical protein
MQASLFLLLCAHIQKQQLHPLAAFTAMQHRLTPPPPPPPLLPSLCCVPTPQLWRRTTA